jgi:glycosyltransferase involved in cell wall biosynthesis
MMQVLRQWPPGYGGVERVAHELATAWWHQGEPITTYGMRRGVESGSDPLPVLYPRIRISTLSIGKLLLLLPCRPLASILCSTEPLLMHFPCPTVLLIGIVSWSLNPNRPIYAYWHAFLESESTFRAFLYGLYEWLALRWLVLARAKVLTTSPVLAGCLRRAGISGSRITVLPCCLSELQEQMCLTKKDERERNRGSVASGGSGLRVAFIGRMGTYKRVDLLVRGFVGSSAKELHVIGSGTTQELQELVSNQVSYGQSVIFHGRLDERSKLEVLCRCDALFLPSYVSNEAFGIAQLEAMACGLAACAPDVLKSGLGWVGGLHLLDGASNPAVAIRAAIEKLSQPHELEWMQAWCFDRYRQKFSREVWHVRLARARKELEL